MNDILDNYIVCLGGGNTQIPFIRKAKLLGYKIICFDKNNNSIGKKIVDQFYNISVLNFKSIVKIIKKKKKQYKITGVIAPCTGEAYLTLNIIKKELNKTFTSLNFVKKLLNKRNLRIDLNKLGASNIKILNIKKLKKNFCQAVVKPIRFGSGSKNVFFIKKPDDIIKYQKKINSKKFITEELINGKQLAVDLIWDGKAIKFFNYGSSIFNKKNNKIIGSASYNLNKNNIKIKNLKKIFKKICKNFIFGPEFIVSEVIIDKAGNLHVIELEFVPWDSIYLAKTSFKYDVIKNFILCHLSKKIENQNKRVLYSVIIHDGKNIIKKNKKIYVEKAFKNFPKKNKNRNFLEFNCYSSKNSRLLTNFVLEQSKNLSYKRY